ncbi:hypothetical protein L3X38_033901 [Prunus dulcis]|uniref:Non-ATPase subunit 9 n=1 Tax=Prunus dulcis TaxID=3755 RepID=A0AAD4VH43_PRUDU|nr:hypothetical protein L3X38_033901 [Prunus dulcis]
MVSQQQSKDSGSKKNGGKELGMVAPQEKSSKKMKFASSSAETEPTSQTTISDDSKSGRGMSTMPRVAKRKLQKLRPIVEYNKRGKGIGQAHSEMQSYIGVLARSRVPLVDMKWSQIPKDIKEQIWEAVDMAFVVGQGGKNSVLSSAAKKWKDFKSTLTRHYILPYTNDREKLSQPPETYKFIEKAQWDAFVASRLSKDFESVHSQHAQIREKFEYNHRLSRKGYVGLEDQLEETMPPSLDCCRPTETAMQITHSIAGTGNCIAVSVSVKQITHCIAGNGNCNTVSVYAMQKIEKSSSLNCSNCIPPRKRQA